MNQRGEAGALHQRGIVHDWEKGRCSGPLEAPDVLALRYRTGPRQRAVRSRRHNPWVATDQPHIPALGRGQKALTKCAQHRAHRPYDPPHRASLGISKMLRARGTRAVPSLLLTSSGVNQTFAALRIVPL